MSVSITTSSIISSTYTSGQTRVSGLVSDFDFDAIIEAQLQSEGISKTSLEEQLAEQEQYLTSLEELDAYLLALQESLESLDSLDEFSSKIATSTDDGIEVIADASSANGYHEVEVGQLAQNDVIVNTGTGFTSTSESIADEDTVFSFSYNGDTVTLDVPSGTSLQELVDMINSDPESRECVTAYLIDDGDAYYFAMSGQDMGEDYAITLEDTGTLTGFGTDQFSRTRTAQNALLKVDGFPAAEDEWIERTTNSVDDVISGLTLELQDVTDGVARINVSTDTETISSNISSVVDDMNVILQYLQIMTGKIEDPYGDESDIYVDTSNYTLNTMYSTLKDVLSSEGIGFTTYDADTGLGDTYSSLSQIGIYTDTDEDSSTFGLLLIDDDALEEALQNDPDAVAELFSIENDCTVDSSDLTFVSLLEGVTQAGDYEVSYEVQDGELVSVTVDGEEASIDGNQITVMSGDAKGLSLLINQDVDGSYSSAVHVKEGKLPELVATLDGMTDSYDGTLQHLIDAAEESLETTSDQIDSETDRLEDLETRLIEKYSTLQSTLSYYAELQESLDSLTASLDSSD
jgi:flagellar hook-associated protein 2